VLPVVAFLAVGVGLLVLPVSEAKLYGFGVWHALDLSALGRSRLRRYLARRRRMRTVGVLFAAAIGLAVSIQNDRVEVQFIPLMTGWLVGAIAAEVTQRQIATGISEPVGVPLRWRYVPAITAVVVVVWTASAVLLRGEGVEPGPLVLWGGGALLPLLAVVLASRRVVATAPHGIGADSEKLESAIVDDGVRGMTMGGVILAVFCIARVWSTAVPGPYEEPSELPITLGLAVIAILVLLNVVPALRISRPGWGWLVFAAVALLPLAWAVPVKVAQQPPITAAEAHAIAQVRLARLDGLAAARDELGLTGTFMVPGYFGDTSAATELIGRVDIAQPAPDGTNYQVFAIDRRTGTGVGYLYGADGAGWQGAWSLTLPARYPWLSGVTVVRGDGLVSDQAMAFSTDPTDPRLAWFTSPVGIAGEYSATDLLLVLMLVRDSDSYVHWATPVPTSTGI